MKTAQDERPLGEAELITLHRVHPQDLDKDRAFNDRIVLTVRLACVALGLLGLLAGCGIYFWS